MTIADAQRDVRRTFLGGFAGSLASALVWLVSACLATWGSASLAIAVLMVGGAAIFPLTQLALRLMGRPVGLPRDHPMNHLAMQVAFVLPLHVPLVGAAALYRIEWFFPAFMLALGAHYLPFVFLYGMWLYGVLAAVLVGAGLGLALYGPASFALGAWVTVVVLVVFAFASRAAVAREGPAGRPAAV
jgi:hypothetical protein